MKKSILYLALFVFCIKVAAQNDTIVQYYQSDTIVPGISMIGSHHQGQNYLRWAPNTPSLWFATSSQGYVIDKYEIGKDLMPNQQSKKSISIKPWPLESFRPYLDSDKENVLAAGQCLYGEWESTKDANKNIFSRADESVNRFGIAMLVADLDSVAARALGLSWIDVDVKEGQKYLYVLKPANDSLAKIYSYALSIDPKFEFLPPPQIDTVDEKEKAVVLFWDKYNSEEFYTAYWLERKGDKDASFVRLTEDPIVPASSSDFISQVVSYQDSVVNYVPYTYRLIGITPFGFMSEPSSPIEAMGRDKTPTDPVSGFEFVEDNGSILLSWKAPEDIDLHHYEVYRGLTLESEFVKISQDLLIDQTSFRDTAKIIIRSPYYMIATIDTAGNKNLSFKLRGYLRDTIAPAPPIGLTATIDSFGVVDLRWIHNTEEDLDGYYIYYANQKDHQYINLTGYPIRSNRFIDTVTLKTLTEKVYYKVTAVDQYNHISRFSEAIEVKRPDTIPPSPAQIVSYNLDDDKVVLNVTPSHSKDVYSQELYKKQMPEGAWEMVASLEGSSFVDSKVIYGQTYQYKMKTMDDDGNQAADHDGVIITILDKSSPAAPQLMDLKQDTSMRAIHIVWKENSNVSQSIIYRSIDNGPFVTLSRSSHINTYIDKDNITSGKAYAYKIKHIMHGGKISPMSQALSINLKPKE